MELFIYFYIYLQKRITHIKTEKLCTLDLIMSKNKLVKYKKNMHIPTDGKTYKWLHSTLVAIVNIFMSLTLYESLIHKWGLKAFILLMFSWFLPILVKTNLNTDLTQIIQNLGQPLFVLI